MWRKGRVMETAGQALLPELVESGLRLAVEAVIGYDPVLSRTPGQR